MVDRVPVLPPIFRPISKLQTGTPLVADANYLYRDLLDSAEAYKSLQGRVDDTGDERLEIGFNAKYLLEIASQVDRENAVFLFNSAADPTLMREGNDMSAVYVVMPMRV